MFQRCPHVRRAMWSRRQLSRLSRSGERRSGFLPIAAGLRTGRIRIRKSQGTSSRRRGRAFPRKACSSDRISEFVDAREVDGNHIYLATIWRRNALSASSASTLPFSTEFQPVSWSVVQQHRACPERTGAGSFFVMAISQSGFCMLACSGFCPRLR